MQRQSVVEKIKQSFLGVNMKFEKRETKLLKWFKAAETGDRQMLKKILKSDFNIDVQNNMGHTALMIATYKRDVKTAAFLIELEADVNSQDHMKNSPFLYAAAEGYLEILQLVGSKGDAKKVNRFGEISIMPASEHADIEVLEWLLTNVESDINHVNSLGWTALLEAVILGDGTDKYLQVVELLLQHGASPDIADKDGVTPLEHAEKQGYTKIFNRLKQ